MAQPQDGRIYPVVLAGGSGTRLWPLSRKLYPKQLQPLVSGATMLQDTVGRIAGDGRFHQPLILCNDEHRFIVAEQLRESAIHPRAIVLEPTGRNTAPACAVAAMMLARDDPEAVLLVMPADHVIRKPEGFAGAVGHALCAAASGRIVTFGIIPERAESGYGYIRRGDGLADAKGCYAIDSFIEKPTPEEAQSLIDQGDYLWNSGIFMFQAGTYLRELERLQPGMVRACRRAIEDGGEDLDFFRLDGAGFAQAPSISIDYAVMEKTQVGAVVPADMGWSDIGSWAALWDIGEKDRDGNVMVGDVVTRSVRNSYVRSDGALTTVIGLEGIIVVVTVDAVLVAAADRAQDVKTLVETLGDRSEPFTHHRVHRPWGSYETVDQGERFQVKRIIVKPGAKLSLQSHQHRAEHWVVVNGTAKVTRADEVITLGENQSVDIPIGVTHRLENPGTEDLHLIEIQSGSYLGEDDIVRFDDSYGRT